MELETRHVLVVSSGSC